MFFMIFFNHLSDPGSGNTHNLISSHWRGSAPASTLAENRGFSFGATSGILRGRI